jgi:integrase/recombinase XerD
LLHLGRGQRRINEDESEHLADAQLEVFDMVGKPLSTSFDAGASLRDVQDYAGHRDPRTTRRYDHSRDSLDRNAAYTVAAYLA